MEFNPNNILNPYVLKIEIFELLLLKKNFFPLAEF